MIFYLMISMIFPNGFLTLFFNVNFQNTGMPRDLYDPFHKPVLLHSSCKEEKN